MVRHPDFALLLLAGWQAGPDASAGIAAKSTRPLKSKSPAPKSAGQTVPFYVTGGLLPDDTVTVARSPSKIATIPR